MCVKNRLWGPLQTGIQSFPRKCAVQFYQTITYICVASKPLTLHWPSSHHQTSDFGKHTHKKLFLYISEYNHLRIFNKLTAPRILMTFVSKNWSCGY